MILTTPIVESLYAGGYTVDMLVRAGNESLLTDHPKIREVLVWEKRKRKYQNWYSMLKTIRSRRYDVVINTHRFLTSGLWTALVNSPDRRGFDQNPLAQFYTQRFPHIQKAGVHEVDRNLSLLKGLDVPLIRKPRLYPSESDFAKVADAQSPYVTISPASVWFTKMYPVKYWVELIKRLPTEVEVHLLGAPSDVELCSEIAHASGRSCRIRAGELNLLQAAALMKGARMNYANDSAPLHLASAMNAPITGFFLNTAPVLGYTPLSDESDVRETHHKLDCRPCGLTGKPACPKGHFLCSEIEPNP